MVSCLRGSGSDVVQPKTTWQALELISACAVDVVLIDFDVSTNPAMLIDACRDVPCVVLADTSEPETLRHLVCHHGIAHVIHAGDDRGAADAQRITLTIEKLLRADVFGLDKHLHGFGADISTLQITDASVRDEVVSNIAEYAKWLGCGRELRQRISDVADELITNAVYNAPRDEHGSPRYAATDRRDKIALDPWEYVQVRFASDGRVFALSVTDWFGGLSVSKIRQVFQRCISADDPIEQKDGGAGLGLYTAFSAANQLIINVEQAERTEIIAVFELGERMRGNKTAGHSLQLFTDESIELAKGSSDCIPSVMVSESMQVDLREAFAAAQPAPFIPLTRAQIKQPAPQDDWDEPTVTVESSPETTSATA